MIDPYAFDQYTPVDSPYWTSSLGPNSTAWTVNFSTGLAVRTQLDDPRYVRCVRYDP